ncbi:MAG: transcriptional regulator [Thermoplasmata archaeon M9B1D]|jgi:putative transcriptional regulator|nr:MAG: transcriptional regulator [Thermoplasmata archaeon M9B1D]PNX49747.1 MAG: transcriptional regulator [Thermoplasmata archaeon M8B2D]
MNIKNALSEKIAGEVTLSPKPGQTIRKWRSVFHISQTDLAKYLNLSPSVVSDYESGRRKSPGIQTVKKIIEAFVEIDEKRGGKILHQYDSMIETQEGILEIMEYPYSIPAKQFIREIEGNTLTTSEISLKKNVKGFTLVDSVKTIETINSGDYNRLYGWSTERAIIFTGIRYGRSPMIAIRVHPVKPTVVVYHRPGSVDSLAIKLADRENIPLVTTNMALDELKKKLVKLGDK